LQSAPEASKKQTDDSGYNHDPDMPYEYVRRFQDRAVELEHRDTSQAGKRPDHRPKQIGL
jgi:hypothetical protein